MSKNLIYMVAINHHTSNTKNSEYSDYSIKTWKWWCDKNDIDFMLITEHDNRLGKPVWNKELIFERAKGYDKIGIIDSDTMVKWDAPNIFELYGEEFCGVVDNSNLNWVSDSIKTRKKFFPNTDIDIDEIPTHGGSLRIYAQHTEQEPTQCKPMTKVLQDEKDAGLCDIETYTQFQMNVQKTKRALLSFLIDAKNNGQTIVGYGAAAKGNTLLNYCGIRNDFIDYVVDKNPHKQGRFLPGTHIPIHTPEKISETKPHYVLILPWNIQEEVIEQMSMVRSWGGQFVVPIPEVKVLA